MNTVGLFFPRESSSTSLHSCISCTGWRLQSGLHSNMQSLCTRVCTCIPYRRALSGGRCRGSSATSFQFIFITDCQPHPTVYRWWPSFSGSAARVWNSLPHLVTSAPSVAVFRSQLKTHLFKISYPSPLWLYSARAVTLSCFGHNNHSSFITYLLTYSELGFHEELYSL